MGSHPPASSICSRSGDKQPADSVAGSLQRAERVDLTIGSIRLSLASVAAKQHDSVAYGKQSFEAPAGDMSQSTEIQKIRQEAPLFF